MSGPELLAPEGIRQRGQLPRGTRFVLIRHGECVANVRGIAAGPRGDGGLTDLGREQAKALASRLAKTTELKGAVALYASTLPRAVETASVIAPFVGGGAEAILREDLGELRVGEGDGLSWQEIAERYDVPDWSDDPSAKCVPGGESLIDFYERARGALEQLADEHPAQLVVVVTHGGVIEQALKIAGRHAPAARLAPRIEHCSMTEVEFDAEKRRLLRYNDLSPLETA